MQKNGMKLYTVFVIFCISVALVVRLGSILTGMIALKAVFAVLVLLGIAINVYQCLGTAGEKAIPPLLASDFHVDVFAGIAAAGFFLRFIAQSVLLFRGVTGRRTEVYFVIAVAVGAVLSLLSCVYFVLIRLSYAKPNYDFRELTFFHLVPLFWSISEIFSVIAGAGEFERDIDSLLKYGMMVMMTLFFFCFVSDIDGTAPVKKATFLFARLCSYLSMLFFFDRLMLLLAGEMRLSDTDNALALSGLMICGFVFFFEKDAYNKNLMNTEQ